MSAVLDKPISKVPGLPVFGSLLSILSEPTRFFVSCGKSLAEIQLALSMARLFYKYDLELDPPDYQLMAKVAPTPGPAMSFRVKVRGLRH